MSDNNLIHRLSESNDKWFKRALEASQQVTNLQLEIEDLKLRIKELQDELS